VLEAELARGCDELVDCSGVDAEMGAVLEFVIGRFRVPAAAASPPVDPEDAWVYEATTRGLMAVRCRFPSYRAGTGRPCPGGFGWASAAAVRVASRVAASPLLPNGFALAESTRSFVGSSAPALTRPPREPRFDERADGLRIDTSITAATVASRAPARPVRSSAVGYCREVAAGLRFWVRAGCRQRSAKWLARSAIPGGGLLSEGVLSGSSSGSKGARSLGRVPRAFGAAVSSRSAGGVGRRGLAHLRRLASPSPVDSTDAHKGLHTTTNFADLVILAAG